MAWDQFLQLGVLLIFLGIALVLAAALMPVVASSRAKTEAGGVILIGPVPIVFGTSRRMAELAALLAGVMLLLALAMYAWVRWG